MVLLVRSFGIWKNVQSGLDFEIGMKEGGGETLKRCKWSHNTMRRAGLVGCYLRGTCDKDEMITYDTYNENNPLLLDLSFVCSENATWVTDCGSFVVVFFFSVYIGLSFIHILPWAF